VVEPPSSAAAAAPEVLAALAEPEPAPEPTPQDAALQRTRKKQRTTVRARPSVRAQARATAPRSEPSTQSMPATARWQPAAEGVGRLRINSRPWSRVFVDGRLVGNTPQAAIEVSPGRHQVELISEEFELRRTLVVDVRAGQTVTRSVELLQ
jgi:serine/threonine-protein kinase